MRSSSKISRHWKRANLNGDKANVLDPFLGDRNEIMVSLGDFAWGDDQLRGG